MSDRQIECNVVSFYSSRKPLMSGQVRPSQSLSKTSIMGQGSLSLSKASSLCPDALLQAFLFHTTRSLEKSFQIRGYFLDFFGVGREFFPEFLALVFSLSFSFFGNWC